jgi:hypothetical protein
MIKPGDGMEMSVVSDIFRARMSQISPFFSHHFLDPIPNIHEDGLFIMKTASESCQHTTFAYLYQCRNSFHVAWLGSNIFGFWVCQKQRGGICGPIMFE